MNRILTKKARLTTWIFNNLELTFNILRRVRPNIILGGQAFITRFDAVNEVLSREDVFHVPYAHKMEKVTSGGNFFLGMQSTPTYTRDVSNMRLTARRSDIPDRIVPYVEATCTEILSNINGKCDVIQALTRVVPTRFIGDYFGTPGWNEDEFTNAAWLMFGYLFYPSDDVSEAKALAAARTTCNYLDQTIQERKQTRGVHDDVLERCLVLQDNELPGMSDTDIRNNLIGLLIGAIPTTSKCAALTLDYLFDHPQLMADAQRAARADDNATMLQYVRESLRLNAFSAGIQRICSRDYTVNEGSLRALRIPEGTPVLAATQSAMMDSRKVDKPAEFRLDRPDYLYMHYGVGLHTCFGQHINDAQIPAIVKAVLKLEGLRRLEPMQSAGPFPVSLKIAFDNNQVSSESEQKSPVKPADREVVA